MYIKRRLKYSHGFFSCSTINNLLFLYSAIAIFRAAKHTNDHMTIVLIGLHKKVFVIFHPFAKELCVDGFACNSNH